MQFCTPYLSAQLAINEAHWSRLTWCRPSGCWNWCRIPAADGRHATYGQHIDRVAHQTANLPHWLAVCIHAYLHRLNFCCVFCASNKQQNTVIYSHMSDQWWIQKFWTGEGGRQFISPVLIYRKCTQRPIAYRPFTRKKAAFWKKIEPIRGGGRLPSPFESATVREWAAHRYTGRYVNAIQSLEAKWGE